MSLLLAGRSAAALVIIATVLVYAPCAMAHKTSYGYLKADFAGHAVSGKLELAVRDFDFAFFDFAFGPADNGGKPNLGQLHRHEQEIAGLLLNKISLGSPGAPCSLDPGPIALDLRGGEYFMILPFSGLCKTTGGPLQAGYDLMFDIDPQHRGLIDVRRDNEVYHDRSIADYSKAIEIDPKYTWAYRNRGGTYAKKGEYDRAIADFDKAIELDPKYAGAYNSRAMVFFTAGKPAQGLPDVEKSLELHPDDPNALDTRGLIFEALGRKQEAIADFRRALAMAPNLQSSKDALKRLGA